jgi:McrBC 5-methylcytosine restriction system component
MEVLELSRGLELRATSFVGRFVLGDLTVTVHPKISDAPLLNLFRYAYGLRDLELYGAADFASPQWTFQDLLVQQLIAEAAELLERGIHREYECSRSSLATPRGRIDFVRYFDTIGRAQTRCRASITREVKTRSLIARYSAACILLLGCRASACRRSCAGRCDFHLSDVAVGSFRDVAPGHPSQKMDWCSIGPRGLTQTHCIAPVTCSHIDLAAPQCAAL